MRTFAAKAVIAAFGLSMLTGCVVNDGSEYRADVYGVGQLNQMQETRPVEIVAVSVGRVALDDSRNAGLATVAGGVIGAIAGAALGGASTHTRHGYKGYHYYNRRANNQVLGGVAGGAVGALAGTAVGGSGTKVVNGVQLTVRDGDRMYTSVQIGRPCEFRLGTALLLAGNPNETRIQPNNPDGCAPQR